MRRSIIKGLCGWFRWVGLSVAVTGGSVALQAQTVPLLQPTLPDDYNQSRNLSVAERPRPDYDPLGIRLGGFVLFPRLDLSVAATDNAFVTASDRKEDVFGRFAPSAELRSDWGRHMLDLSGHAVFLHHAHQGALDRDTWDIRSAGRLDVGDFASLSVEGQAAKLQEDPFTSQTDPALAVLSSYRRDRLAVRAEREAGRTRLVVSFETQHLRFGDIDFADGAAQSQAQRDRDLAIGAAQAEYALSPGAVLLARIAYTDTDYQHRLGDGDPNRDAKAWQAVGGINLDLPDFIRGTVQLGYTRKTYRAAVYKTVDGVSGEAKLEYFLSDLMNFELDARRTLEDAATSDNNPYFETLVSFGADRSVRANIVVGAKIGVGRQAYIGSPIRYDILQAGAYLRYLVSHSLSLRLDGGYGKRVQPGTRSKIDQSTVMMTMELHK